MVHLHLLLGFVFDWDVDISVPCNLDHVVFLSSLPCFFFQNLCPVFLQVVEEYMHVVVSVLEKLLGFRIAQSLVVK